MSVVKRKSVYLVELIDFVFFLVDQTKDINIHDELFSAENGLLTPTFKNKRATIADYFKDQITEMYRPL